MHHSEGHKEPLLSKEKFKKMQVHLHCGVGAAWAPRGFGVSDKCGAQKLELGEMKLAQKVLRKWLIPRRALSAGDALRLDPGQQPAPRPEDKELGSAPRCSVRRLGLVRARGQTGWFNDLPWPESSLFSSGDT